jgi:ribosomal protein S12 methylthiotransferase accessory factor
MAINIFFDGGKKVNAVIHGFTVKTDQPIREGGENTAPAPFALFLASLATCAGFYVKSFCDHRNIPADEITLTMNYEVDQATHLISKMIIEINVPQDFPEKYDAAVINAAAVCTVKRHLNPEIQHIITVKRK